MVEGSKEGLIPDLDEALTKYGALEIINGPLMAGMTEVGRLFNNNELIVAEVFAKRRSNESLRGLSRILYGEKRVVCQRENHACHREGDVHDIGKTWWRSSYPTMVTKSLIWV